ncbi:ROK family transcriptional regulator [Bailinhaonella thermotolerans]|uniref:ROK family transcriptional regulator n=1 Tax=Bailinhaonella thermotolerans TaxID=1070861 RepID=A0A3A4ADN6_9ACTN|nr:ROK family transcriptional regulator [Bailinhaonella thermotolerans]RJL26541.1 ROK family transcriptional regulator [Bailinhaonella thermotolerans]
MATRPGTPRLLRELNDRAALELLLASGPLTRAQLGELTGLSKVTAAQMLSRLEERGLVEVVGEQSGSRGPNAALYAVVPSCAYVAALDVNFELVTAGVADITGRVVAEVTADPNGGEDPVKIVHNAVLKACRRAEVPLDRLSAIVIGTGGVVDPRTGDVTFSFNLPEWHEGVLEALRHDLRRPVIIENDVNLAAVAERPHMDTGDFVLMWVDVGQGLGVMLNGRLHRGLTGGAGEIGWLPVPGEPLPPGVSTSHHGPFQRLVGGPTVRDLAASYGFAAESAEECVRLAAASGTEEGGRFLDEFANRLAIGVAAVCVVLDPGHIVLAGRVGRAGGSQLAERVQEAVRRICPSQPRVTTTQVEGNPILRGALLAALDTAREEVFTQ